MTTSPAAILACLVRAAARQRQFMIPWLEDKRFVIEGGTLFHAVDTDVVKLYTAPEEEAVTKQHKEGYAQVFPSDNPDLSEALGRALAEHIFYRLTGQQPLLIIPPMEQEVRRVFAGIARNAEKEQRQVNEETQRLQRLADDLKEEQDQKAILDRLAAEAPQLARFLARRRGHDAELRRFGCLLKDTRIVPLAFALEKGLIVGQTLNDALAEVENFKDRVWLRDRRDDWFERLSKEKSPATSSVLIYDDAQVLARLEWINNRLDKRHRLLLVTGDPSLHEVARHYKPEGREACLADLYLRHPRAYLAEPQVLSPETAYPDGKVADRMEFLQWLDTFLAETSTDDQEYTKRLDILIAREDQQLVNMASRVLETRPGIVEDFQQKWENYTGSLVLVHGFPESAAAAESKSLRKLENDLQAVLNKVKVLLKERLRETWDECFVVATEAGWLLSKAADSKMRPRNIPALSSDSFRRTEAFAKYLLGARESDQRQATENSLKKISELEDESGYAYYLAYALLFAAEGGWHVAAILTERALDIANTGQYPLISGREAAYLRAVALRHNARRVSDLADVKFLLERASTCLEKDRRERPSLKVSPVRFEAEYLALALTYHLFRLFQNESIPKDVTPLAKVQEDIEALLVEIRAREPKEWIVRRVERNLLADFFMITLLRWSMEKEPLEPTILNGIFNRFKDNLESQDQPKIEISFLEQAVYFAAAWWITSNDLKKRDWREKLTCLLTKDAIEKNSVLPYDGRRFRFLRELAIR